MHNPDVDPPAMLSWNVLHVRFHKIQEDVQHLFQMSNKPCILMQKKHCLEMSLEACMSEYLDFETV